MLLFPVKLIFRLRSTTFGDYFYSWHEQEKGRERERERWLAWISINWSTNIFWWKIKWFILMRRFHLETSTMTLLSNPNHFLFSIIQKVINYNLFLLVPNYLNIFYKRVGRDSTCRTPLVEKFSEKFWLMIFVDNLQSMNHSCAHICIANGIERKLWFSVEYISNYLRWTAIFVSIKFIALVTFTFPVHY